MFVVTNGEYYIAQISNGLKPVKTTEDALRFNCRSKAINFASTMPKTFKNLGYHVEECVSNISEVPKGLIPQHKRVSSPINSASVNPGVQEIKKKVCEFSEFLNNLEMERQSCCDTVASCDRKTLDIMHEAEFYNLNASSGYKVYARLRDIRRERRIAKDKIIAIDAVFEENKFDGILNKKTINKISGLENRKYAVRELDEIFPDD